jgi:uncharacterized protein (TIGR02391 family)
VNLQTHLPERLWRAVATAYEAENYAHAILEATYFISALLRERAGVDGDGAALVAQALGGDSPRLKLNALQSESEKNIQKGFEQILRGVYQGIRNPRAHEPTVDSKETADAIIHFLGYVASLLSISREAFTVDAFVARVFDPEFVESKRYAELVVTEVPKLRLADAAIALFRARKKNDLRKLRHLVPALLGALSPGQLAAYLSVVSDELRTTTDETEIRTALQMLTPAVWSQLDELARLRIENKLIGGIRTGEVLQNGRTTQALATWSSDFLKAFTQRSDAASALLGRLESSDSDARHYAAKFFMRYLPEVMSHQYQVSRCIAAIVKAVKSDDAHVSQALVGAVHYFPEDWQKKLGEELKDKTDEDNPGAYLFDGSPFLASPAKDDFEDDIPF